MVKMFFILGLNLLVPVISSGITYHASLLSQDSISLSGTVLTSMLLGTTLPPTILTPFRPEFEPSKSNQ